jgi:hypothetical protein
MPGATIARPPVAHERLKLSDCGQVVYELKTPYRDGTTHVVMSPLEWMAVSPRSARASPPSAPATAMDGGSAENAGAVFRIRYHGILAPNAKWRAQVVPKVTGRIPTDPIEDESPKRNYIPWARLLRRVFALDLDHCPTCNGPLKLIAVIEQAAVIEKILAHLNLNTHPPPRTPARYDPIDEAELYWNPATPIPSVH